MKIVAHMLVRNEADVIAGTVGEILRWVDALVVLAGASDDGTLETLSQLAAFYDGGGGKRIHLTSRPDPGDRFADHFRNELLELTGALDPDWVISVDADEIYAGFPHSPITAIEAAEAAGANTVWCMIPQFWLTFDDLRSGALHEDPAISIQARRRWYSWGHTGVFIWRWNPDHFYPADTPKRTPELPGQTWREWQRPGPIKAVCRHYPIRTLEQGLARARERLARGGRRYFGKYALNWLIDERAADLHYFDPAHPGWNMRPNHDRVCAYMAGEL